MLVHPRLKSLASGVVVLGLVGVAQAAIPATADAATAVPSVVRAYGGPPPIQAVVNSGGRAATIDFGTGNGRATVTVGGRRFFARVVNGVMTFRFPANLPLGSYPFTARFNGRTFTSTLYVTRFGTVIGIEAYRALMRKNGVGTNRGGVAGTESESGSNSLGSAGTGGSDSNGSGSGSGSLANTGATTQTELLGLLGLGLLAAGGSSIVIARRRARI
jgi:LPXTG-motif cell wall-anchored protein